MFDSPDRLLLGLLIGIVFGVLLQKGQVAKFSVIVGQFILKDCTVVKIMGTAVVVGSVGVTPGPCGRRTSWGRTVLKWGDRGKLMLPELVGASPATFVLIFASLLVVALVVLDRVTVR